MKENFCKELQTRERFYAMTKILFQQSRRLHGFFSGPNAPLDRVVLEDALIRLEQIIEIIKREVRDVD